MVNISEKRRTHRVFSVRLSINQVKGKEKEQMSKKLGLLLAILMMASLLLAACAPQQDSRGRKGGCQDRRGRKGS